MYETLFKCHSDLLQALAHPKRLEILQLLREEELTVSQIHEMLDLSQSNVSQHLQILREAGIVHSRRDGKQMLYRVKDKRFIKASDLFREILIDQHKDDNKLTEACCMKMKELLPLTHDPVCDMRLSPKTASFSEEYKNKRYFFCASGCVKKFLKSPELYVK